MGTACRPVPITFSQAQKATPAANTPDKLGSDVTADGNRPVAGRVQFFCCRVNSILVDFYQRHCGSRFREGSSSRQTYTRTSPGNKRGLVVEYVFIITSFVTLCVAIAHIILTPVDHDSAPLFAPYRARYCSSLTFSFQITFLPSRTPVRTRCVIGESGVAPCQ
jgi:hypothetical protein